MKGELERTNYSTIQKATCLLSSLSSEKRKVFILDENLKVDILITKLRWYWVNYKGQRMI